MRRSVVSLCLESSKLWPAWSRYLHKIIYVCHFVQCLMWLFVLMGLLIKKKRKKTNKPPSQSISYSPTDNKQHHVEAMCSSFGSVLSEYEPTMQISIKKKQKKTSEPLSMWGGRPVAETHRVDEDSRNRRVITVCAIKSSNARFEVHKKSSICLYFKDSQLFPSLCEDRLCSPEEVCEVTWTVRGRHAKRDALSTRRDASRRIIDPCKKVPLLFCRGCMFI